MTPSTGTGGAVVGYHSNRRAPTAAAIRLIEPFYATLLTAERHHPRPADAIAASTELLQRSLAERGLTYDEFVWSVAATKAAV